MKYKRRKAISIFYDSENTERKIISPDGPPNNYVLYKMYTSEKTPGTSKDLSTFKICFVNGAIISSLSRWTGLDKMTNWG